ncbi:MAG: helix-turn-helix domain-containing protein [Pseudomonadota bacterium]
MTAPATPSTGPTRRRLPPAQRIEQILDAAMALVLRQGIAQVNMNAVAAEAGVSKGLVYAYFGNITELLQAVYVRAQKQLNQQHMESLATPHTFEEMVRKTAQISRANRHSRRLLIQRLSADPAIQAVMQSEDVANRQRIVAFLSREIVHNYAIPPRLAELATALALRYDEMPEFAETFAADPTELDEIWAAMIVGAMQELQRRHRNQEGESGQQSEQDGRQE